MKTLVVVLLLSLISQQMCGQDREWSPLKKGPYKVGLKTVRINSKAGNPMLISIWYPAQAQTAALSLADLIKLGGAELNVADTVKLKNFFSPIGWMFDVKMDYGRYLQTIEGRTRTFLEPKPITQRFPLILALARPSTYFETFEFLTSHGYVVAGIDCKFSNDPPPPPLHYTRSTDIMEELLAYMEKEENVNTNSIIVFGHGFGINPALYLAMRTGKIKKAINLDGGFFGPRSNTTTSNDYKPDRLTIPLLHVITIGQQKEDDPEQFATLKNPILRVGIQSAEFKHQDVSAWGRLFTLTMRKSDEAAIVNDLYVYIHEIMLDFLKDKSVITNYQNLRIEKFN